MAIDYEENSNGIIALKNSNVKIFTTNIESAAFEQISELVKQPAFANSKIRIMPDVHAGAGCVIGFTADLGDKVIPNIVGVDIGCGVRVVKLGNIKIDYPALDNFIKEKIPAGFCVGNTSYIKYTGFTLQDLYCYNELQNTNRLELGVCSLGGGNHFIEVDEGSDGQKYLVIHTGSRNLGKQVAIIYQEKAVAYCRSICDDIVRAKIEELKSKGLQSQIEQEIHAIREHFNEYSTPKELCFLEGEERKNYLHDMKLCQLYARTNRSLIARKITEYLGLTRCEEFESVHNYIDDTNMVRKGAVEAHKGQKVIIPLNMRDGSILGIGKGNSDWNESAPHGAGRLLARGEAKRILQLEDFTEAMQGIYTTTADQSTIDESPMAYKDATEIINAIEDTVDIVDLIKPVYNFKAAE